jgi:ankyrin repeat protein
MRLGSPTLEADVDDRLHRAARNGNLAAIGALLAEGLDINSVDHIGHTPLHLAVTAGHVEVIDRLVDAGADINAQASGEGWQDDTPLGCVADSCSVEFAEYLLRLGADPRCPGWMGITPLDRAKERKDRAGKSVYERLMDVRRAGH